MGLTQGVLVDKKETESIARLAEVLAGDVAEGVGKEGPGVGVAAGAHALVEKNEGVGRRRRRCGRRRRRFVPTAGEKEKSEEDGEGAAPAAGLRPVGARS
jgi:hypothetical protein